MKEKYTYLIVIFLIVASCATFGRIAGNDFINFDDNIYITENIHIKSGINSGSVKWAFNAFVSSNWHPLTWISLMLDHSLFGANPGGYHLINLLLHIGAVIFLFLFLNKTTNNIWPSAFVAALFALHPLRVESVAWAAERKDVLSMFFGMAALYSYSFYAESSRLSRYFLCLILFALSLMAKSMLVTLPFVLILLDYWPLKRWQKELKSVDPIIKNETSPLVNSRGHLTGKLLWEKVPFLFLTIASCIMTVWAQYETRLTHLTFPLRVVNAVISYVSYLGKIFLPVDLAVIYPFVHSFPLWQILGSAFILIGVTVFVIYFVKKQPFLFVGWFWYLGTLVPVSGLVSVNAPMADHYTYLPSIGIGVMLAWGTPLLLNSEFLRKKILFPAAITVIAILVVLTWQQCGYWKNDISLFDHALRVTKDNHIAHNNLAVALVEKGKMKEANFHFNEAIRIQPDYAIVYRAIDNNNKGIMYSRFAQYELASKYYNEAIRLKPDYSPVYYNRGSLYMILGQHQLAIEDFNNFLRLDSDCAICYHKIGIIYGELHQYRSAIDNFGKAINLKPDYFKAYKNRGFAYATLGEYQNAIDDYSEALLIQPNDAGTYHNRSLAYLLQNNIKSFCDDAQKACELGNCATLELAKGKGRCL